jgi:hypothetical protein
MAEIPAAFLPVTGEEIEAVAVVAPPKTSASVMADMITLLPWIRSVLMNALSS